MPVICTVRIPLPLAQVEEVEKGNPEILKAIIAGAREHMLSHRRFASDSEVLDIDEYATREDYEAFMAGATEAIGQLAEVLGVKPRDEVWQVIEH